MKGSILVLSIAVLSLISFFSCASQKVLPPSEVKPRVEDKVLQPWEMEWQETIVQARKEGRVLIYTSVGVDVRSIMAKIIKDKFGVNAELVSMRGAEVNAKIISERRVGLYLGDILIHGAGPPRFELKPLNALDPVEPALILPEVKDLGMWYQGRLPFIDQDDRMIFSFSAQHNHSLTFNTQMVKREEIASYYDLLHPKWKAKIVFNDPTTPGSGSSGFTVLAFRILGLDYFKEMAKLEPAIVRDQRLQVEWIARGKYPLGFFAQTDNVLEFLRSGAPVERHTPKEGSYVTSSGNNLMLLNRAPHPNAARFFINFILSKEGQDIWAKYSGAQSTRNDASNEGLRPEDLRRPDMLYIHGDDEDITLAKPKYREIAKEIFGSLMK